jgi:hypothetical protein
MEENRIFDLVLVKYAYILVIYGHFLVECGRSLEIFGIDVLYLLSDTGRYAPAGLLMMTTLLQERRAWRGSNNIVSIPTPSPSPSPRQRRQRHSNTNTVAVAAPAPAAAAASQHQPAQAALAGLSNWVGAGWDMIWIGWGPTRIRWGPIRIGWGRHQHRL